MIEGLINFLLKIIGDVQDDTEIDEKIKEVERCKLRYELKRLRRK
jgi:hypothetical protein